MIEETEERRLRKQAYLDACLSAAERNRLGQFATPPALARDMLQLAKQFIASVEHIRFLDPAIGTGAFFSALLQTFGREPIRSATGFEADRRIAKIADELWEPFGLCLRCEDFTQAAEPQAESERFNLIVCNPPYIRHHHLDPKTKRRLKHLIAQRTGLAISGLAGLYCYFMLLADAWLADKGIALWLIPAEFLDVNYGSTLRQYLSTRVSLRRIHLFNPEDVQFPDALVSSCVVVLEKTEPVPELEVQLSSGGSLLKPNHICPATIAKLRQSYKWSRLATGSPILKQDKVGPPETRLTVGDLFEIKRGLATGANEFFILPLERARELALPDEFLQPILPSPRHIKSKRIEADQQGWPLGLQRLVLLKCDLPRHMIKELYPTLDRYLRFGETSGLIHRYLLRTRQPWYKQESRPPAPILCTYMGRRKAAGRIFRFFRNCSKATAPNVYLMLYPKHWLEEAKLRDPGILEKIFSALQRLSDEDCLSEGRTYGGGLNKLEPRELAKLSLNLGNDSLEDNFVFYKSPEQLSLPE